MTRSYPSELYIGFAEELARLTLVGAPAFTFRHPDTGGDYLPSEPRPIYSQMKTNVTGEHAVILPRIVGEDVNGNVTYDTQVLYIGPPDGGFLDAQDMGELIAEHFCPGMRPRVHFQLGAVRLGQLRRMTVVPAGRDIASKRQHVSINFRSRGKRFTV